MIEFYAGLDSTNVGMELHLRISAPSEANNEFATESADCTDQMHDPESAKSALRGLTHLLR